MDEKMVIVCLGDTRQRSSVSNRIHITMFSFVGLIKYITEFSNVIHVFD